ncbi:dephospho-CoA kinase [Pilimelia columellifera]|uniref:dephospho-CoA kinase n=1 Tax=Pilimelia columellifera TaxID=706574 RepID=UPI0031D15C8F
MLTIGLTGGIGAGKSTVARRLGALGAVVIDADVVARDVVRAGGDGLAEVVAAFGSRVVGADGELDRVALGAIVFADADRRALLERIIHPRVRERAERLERSAPADAIVVHDIPLLVESGQAAAFPLVIVVAATVETRVARLIRHRAMPAGQARARIDAQASDADRLAAADVVLRNDGPVDALDESVDRLWNERLLPFEANLRRGQSPPRPEPLVVVPLDPSWPEQAARLIARLRRALGAAVVRADHVGPTAVGRPAVDVLDIQVVTPSVETARAGVARCAGIGLVPDGAGASADREQVLGRLREADPGRLVNVRLVPRQSPLWADELRLRDWLRADPDGRGDASADGYAQARAWAERRGWSP